MPRLSLSAQVYLGVAALVLALLLVAAVAWVDAGRQANAHFEGEIDDGLQSFQSDFVRATRDLAALGNWLVAQKNLQDLVGSRDSAGLTRYLEPWTEVSIADSLTVLDNNGIVLAELQPGQPVQTGDNLHDLQGVAEALSGKNLSGLGQDQSGRLRGQLILPVYAAESKSPVGALILGFYVDGSFLQYRARNPNQEIALVDNDRLTIITLTDQYGKPWGGQLAPAAVLKAQRTSAPTDFILIQTDVGPYLFKFNPFATVGDEQKGMYGVGVSLPAFDAERWSLIRVLGIGILAIAGLTCLGGFFFARALIAPIRKLDAAAQAIASGDLSHTIHLRRKDELGDLALQMECMQQQLRRALDSAQLEKGRASAVIESMGAAAIITDQCLNIAVVNPAAETLLKENQQDLIGQSWQKLFTVNGNEGDATHRAWSLGEAEVGGDRSLIVRGRFPLRARPQMTIEVLSSQIEVAGQPAGYVHILQDASAQEQLVRTKDEFIMNAAHELRGPLASLRASIELLVERYAKMEKQDLGFMLRTMQRAVVKFQGLVETLIDVGNIQAGKFRVRALPTRFDTLLENALTQIDPLLQGRSQRVEIEMECPTPCMVLADRPRIAQVLINLITNASKYGPEGQPITLSVFSRDGFVVVEVTDRGPGIPPEEQATLFQRFYRGRRAEEEGIGIGLGLALAREIVKSHGGQMDLRSRLGEGTTFWFSVPVAAASKKEGQPR